MSVNLCYADAYRRDVEAEVREVIPAEGGPQVILDRTVFYPGGGGQPPDRGHLRAPDGRTWTVTSARRSGEDVVHELEHGVTPPGVG